ncbi:MAG: dihydrolipoyl dehydrogenase [Acidobacteria bacterium]|jgi:dihydrolipoamide dehydrogenase|nr:dihydrolipoyl dehydrogenase [Acidobacteriota bacterium]
MYDIIFIGGGPGGYEGAIAAGKKGLKTAVVEMEKVGGTCLQWGCVPTKALLHNVKLIKQIKNGAKAGINVENIHIDIDALAKNKERVVSKLTKGIETLFKQYNVELIQGRGKITAPDTVLVNNQQELKSKHIVIATGSIGAELPFLKVDGEYVIDSNIALELKKVPEKLLVVGAGAVGLELGLVYSYLGSQVTVVEIMDQILPGMDTELSEILKNELKKQKMKIHTATGASNPLINPETKTIRLDFKPVNPGPKEWQEEFSHVLLAVGRKPNTVGIIDESAQLGIQMDKRGFIIVNENLQTAAQNIFACGDVVGNPLLAHKASHQAMAIVDFIKEGKPIVHHPVPGAVFTFPEFASIGLTEAEAKSRGMNIKVGRFPYSAGSRSNAIDEKAGMVKVIADEDHRLIGAHIVGAEAGELMPILNYAVTKGMKAEEFKEMTFIHPTLCENIWEAVGEISGTSIHI